MECTQQIPCTQEIHENAYNKTPKAGPKQVGFLGICGSKYPLNKGPNKVGRDPDTCNVVLNDNSISRQHAVINILNDKDFMLMDLDSSNKTKLLGVTLQPYIPHPLRNGDTVQFGQAFGIFRLLEEDDDLPMTQAVDIPETPVRQITKLAVGPTTVIPESPDVSDRDDSIIVQSQPKKIIQRSGTNKFIKSARSLNVGINKIDNVYWSSSKKSDSFSSQLETNLNLSVGKCIVSPKKVIVEQNNIYDLETQAPDLAKHHQSSIFDAKTQIPEKKLSSTIHTLDTQLPNRDNLPEVYRVQEQNNVQLNLYSTSKKTIDIFDAETQVELQEKEKKVHTPSIVTTSVKTSCETVSKVTKNKLNSSDEEIIFDEVDSQPLDDICESQPLLSDFGQIVLSMNTEKLPLDTNQSKHNDERKDDKKLTSNSKNSNQDDEDITDCEDNMVELIVKDKPNKNQSDDDITDCEDVISNVKINEVRKPNDDDLTDCEDDEIEISQNRIKTSDINDFDNLPTQVIEEEENQGDVSFEDMLTQVIDHCSPNDNSVNPEEKSAPFEELQTQVIEVDEDQTNSKSPLNYTNDIFKVPRFSPKLKRKDVTGIKKSKDATSTLIKTNVDNKDEDDQNYYNATQDIMDDLCSQMVTNNNSLIQNKSLEESDGNERIQSYVSRLSKDQIREVIGANVCPQSKKKSSDSSDVDLTPKKFTPSKILSINLPDSQDIKSCKFVSSHKPESDSDPFEHSQEDVLEESSFFSNIKRRKKIKQNLSKKFDIDTLPTRAITRIRKPTNKLVDCDETTKKMNEKILQSRLGLDNTHEVDKEVIHANLARVRRRIEKNKNKLASSKQSDEPEKREKSEKTMCNDKPDSNIDKKLKQPDIKSMFREIKAKESDNNKKANPKAESKELVDENRRSSRNKNKNEKTPPEDRKSKKESRDRKHTSSRSHKRGRTNSEERQKIKVIDEKIKPKTRGSKPNSRTDKKLETNVKEKEIIKVKLGLIDLTLQEDEPVVRRSRRKQAQSEIKDKKEMSRKSNEKKETTKQEREHRDRNRSRENKTSKNNQNKVSNSSTEKDSSANLKRKACSSDDLPAVSKKTKHSSASSSRKHNSDQGEVTFTRGVRKHRVLFTAFPPDLVKGKLEKYGAEIVNDVRSSTVVLTMKIRRTFKLLCAIGLGIPIVGPTWVQACVDSGTIVDPWLYLINDEESEKRFHFNLRHSLSVERNFLKGYNISCTPNVSPNPQEMESIVECSGGTWGEGGRKWYCVSCPQDKPLIPSLKRRGAIVVNNEFILCGVLRQKLLDKDKLSIP